MEVRSVSLLVLVAVVLSASGGAAAQQASGVVATYNPDTINWDLRAVSAYCSTWDADMPLAWRRCYGCGEDCVGVGVEQFACMRDAARVGVCAGDEHGDGGERGGEGGGPVLQPAGSTSTSPCSGRSTPTAAAWPTGTSSSTTSSWTAKTRSP
uniref:Barwin domain-containing protein n=1 Tax=Oryza barthii TaxID=65489 RepID=A0A0D3HNJ8_9ORYZ